MQWGHLATQFCLELAFGVSLGLCLLPRAPLGRFFQRMMAVTVALPLAVAACAQPLLMGGSFWDPVGLAAAAALLGLPVLSGPVPSSRRMGGAVWCTTWTGIAIVRAMGQVPGLSADPWGTALGSLSAMATGTVAGGVGLAMVVGHWYLTVPQLPVAWLRMLNRFSVGAMVASALLLALSCWVHAEALAGADTPLLGPWGLFHLGSRVSVGLVLPMVFAWMTASSLRHGNTRSATGILYASTVLVLIGTAASLSLQDSFGVPL